MIRKLTLSAAGLALAASLGAAQPAAAAGELFLYNWSNYFPPELLTKFQEDTGIRVTLDVYDSNETMLAKLQAGASGYDIAVPSDYMVEAMIKQDLIERIDAAQLPNFKNVSAPHDKPWYDPERAYSAPYMWGTTGFSYDGARVPGKLEESWAVFFDPPAELEGQTVALNDEVELFKAAAMYLGIDPCTEDREDASRVYDLLAAQKPQLAMYQSDGTIERMIAKEVIMHMQWNGAAHRTRKGLPSLVYVYPKEGINLWSDNFVVLKDAPNKENAKIFIDWMLDPRNAAAASNFTGYMNAVPASAEFLDEDLRSDPAVVPPPGAEARFNENKQCSQENRDLRNRVWTRLRS
ncbi:extracellular solute-binding protein [Arenibaculum sp.]|uniref:extracellular solute-binding protein n=1 Tax=Arenibaculum sp. TaxID=2865862 RepID=UPI002E141040|nr:extracellular solute-binding protein [Arenibaculum sp.]